MTPIAPIPRSAWLALGVSTLAALLTVIDVSIVNVAFPSIRRELGASEAGLSWVLSGYSVAIGAFLLIAGRLADRKGRRRTFMVGVVVFIVGSLGSGIAPAVGWLIAARVVQGIGASILSPASLSMILPLFPPDRRSMVIGVWGASAALGAALGPSAGAILLDLLSWRWVFLVNVPIGALILALAPRYVTESLDPDAEGGFDLVGVPAGTLGVALLLVAVVQGGEWGYGSATTVVVAVVGLALLGLLVVRSATHPAPLLDLGLFRLRSFWSASAGQVFFTTAFIAIILFNTLLLQEWWQWSPLSAGFGVVAGPVLAAIIGGPIGAIADRFGHRRLLVIGCLAAAGNPTWLWIRAEAEPNYVVTVLPALLMLGVGVACSFATFASLGLRDVPQARFATASATLRTTSTLGFAVGVAIAIAVYSAAIHLGPVVAYRRTWAFMAITLFVGAAFCRLFCPPRSPATVETQATPA